MMPATMPAWSWSLPSDGEMLCTVCSSGSNCTGKRAVAQRRARDRRPRPVPKPPEIWTSRPVMPGLIVGADWTTPSSSIATVGSDERRDLLDELVVPELDVRDVLGRVRVVLGAGRVDVAAGHQRGTEEVADVRLSVVAAAGRGARSSLPACSRRASRPGRNTSGPAAGSNRRRGNRGGAVARRSFPASAPGARPRSARSGSPARRATRLRRSWWSPPVAAPWSSRRRQSSASRRGTVVVVGIGSSHGNVALHDAEAQLRGLADELLGLLAVFHAGQVDDDRVALALHLGFGDAERRRRGCG